MNQQTETPIDTETVIEPWELTLPEEEAGCESSIEECPNSAHWLLVSHPCGHSKALCDSHKEYSARRTTEEGHLRHGLIVCTRCKTTCTNLVYLPI